MIKKKPLLPIQRKFRPYAQAYGALDEFGCQGKLIEFVGEPGSGKSTVADAFTDSHDNAHKIVCSQAMGVKDLMQKIAEKAGAHLTGNTYTFQDQLTKVLKERGELIFILDECEYLIKRNADKLDVIRQIWDETSNAFIFCGTYKLRKMLIGDSRNPEASYSQLYRRMKKVKMGIIPQDQFYEYLSIIEQYYAVTFGKEARNTLYTYCTDMKHGGLGTCLEILKSALDYVRPEWIAISLHLAVDDETADYFPRDYCMTTPEEDLINYNPKAIYISKEDIASLKPVNVSGSLLRSASMYQITA